MYGAQLVHVKTNRFNSMLLQKIFLFLLSAIFKKFNLLENQVILIADKVFSPSLTNPTTHQQT